MPSNRNLRAVAGALLLVLAACGSPTRSAYTGPSIDEARRATAVSRALNDQAAAEVAAMADLQPSLDRLAQQQRPARLAVVARPRPARAARSATAPRPVPAVMDAAFWRRLANCENADGDGDGNGGGYFQFGPDTARKVGYRPGMSYDEQVVLAERWLAMIGGPSRGGTRSGWPVCWWRAL